MKCFNHPAQDAVGMCANCGRAGCRECLVDVGHGILCPICRRQAEREFAAIAQEVADKARGAIRFSWIFTTLGALVAVPAAFSSAGVGGIILAPVLVYLVWSFFWGIGPVWRGFSNVFAGWGIMGSWMFLLIAAILLCELLVLVAVTYGALGGGISRYNKAKRNLELAA